MPWTKQMTRFLSVVFFLCGSLAMAYAEQYLCTADRATGFSFNKSTNGWQPTTFKTDKKYVISVPDRQPFTEKMTFQVKEIGESFAHLWCREGFSQTGNLFCTTAWGTEFKFNKNNGRYLSTVTFGYATMLPGSINNSTVNFTATDDVYIEIGKCSSF